MAHTKPLQATALVLGSLLFGIALSGVLAEFYYRRAEKTFYLTPSCEWIADPATGFANPPNMQCHHVTAEFDTLYALNSDGHPSSEFNNDPRACSVMALGDSHTLAVGVSTGEAWPNIAESLLKPDFHRPFQVVNMGVAGYSVGQEYSQMQKYLGKYKPKHVVLGFSLATDAYDIRTPAQGGFIYGPQFTRPYFDVENNVLVLRAAPHGTSSKDEARSVSDTHTSFAADLKSFLMTNSAFYRAVYRGVIGQYGARFLKKFGVNPWPNAETVLAKKLDRVDEHSWLIVEKLLEEFNTTLGKEHVGFTVVIIPYLPQVYDAVWNRTFASEADKYDRFAASKRLSQICQRYGLDCLDLTVPFIEEARSKGKWLHYRQDGHPTREGQALIGRLAAEHLAEQLLRECPQ